MPQFWEDPASGCALFSLQYEERIAAVDAARERLAAFTEGLNARLRASG